MSSSLKNLGPNFLVGLASTELLPEEKTLLARLKPLGVILFSHNVDRQNPRWPQIFKQLIESAKEAAGRKDFLVSIDHEGGRVHRLAPPATHFSSACSWGKNAQAVGHAMGRELRALSCNLNFAPVLDVWSEPKNSVIADRAFSKNADEVATLATQFLTGLESEGVLGCGKHFPGHGGTVADSHFELPILDESPETLEKRELLPFRQAISHGVGLLMTAHVLYPQLDSQFPATLSKAILCKKLRQEFNFQGSVVSDGLEMKALANMTLDEVGPLSLNSGVDILLIAQPKDILPLRMAETIANSILQALEKGDIDEARLRIAQKRNEQLFSRLAIIRQDKPDTDYPLTLLGCEKHRQLAERLKERE